MNQRKEDTALGVARARFVDSLPRKAEEMEGAVRALRSSPEDAGAREELRKRFHALYASAQVFRIQELAEGLKRCLALIDDARDQGRSLNPQELEELDTVLGSLNELATGQRPSIIPNMDDAVDNARSSTRPPSLGFSHQRPAPPPPAAPSPGFPVAKVPAAAPPPPRPASNPGFPAVRVPAPAPPPRPTSSPGFSAVKVPAPAPPRPTSSPGFPAVKVPAPAPPRPTSSPGLPVARKPSSPGMPVARKPSSPSVPAAGGFGGNTTKSSAFAPRSGGSIPPRPAAEKRLVASRFATTIEVDRILVLMMVGAEPIAQRLSAVLPESRVELIQCASERDAVDAALECGPDVVVVAPSFAPLLADAFAEAGLHAVPRVQLSPPGAPERDYQLHGVDAVVAVNAPPSKMAQTIVDVALEAAGPAPRRVMPLRSSLEGDLSGVDVVVAFDEPGITHFVAHELERAGARVHRGSDGHRALSLARALRPQLLLTCAGLPALDGPEVVRRVERDPFLTETRAMVLELDEALRAKMRAGPELPEARDEAGGGFLRDLVFAVSGAREATLEALRASSLGRPRRGRIRGVGASALLEALEAGGADARLELRDTERTLELELRGGRPVVGTFTASSGEFVRGDRAFIRAASFTGGRFRVSAAEGEPKGPPIADDARARLEAELVRRSVLLERLEEALPDHVELELDPDLAAAAGLEESQVRALGEPLTLGALSAQLGDGSAGERLDALIREGAVVRLTDPRGPVDLIAEGLARRGEPAEAAALDLVDTTPGHVPAPELTDELSDELQEEIEIEADAEEQQPPPVAAAAPKAPPPVVTAPQAPPVAAAAPKAPPPVVTAPQAPPPVVTAAPQALRTEAAPPPLEVGDDDELVVPPRRRMSGGLVALLATVVVAGAGFAAIEFFDLSSLVSHGSETSVAEGREALATAAEREAQDPMNGATKPPALVDPFPEIARFYGERREGLAEGAGSVPEGHGLVVIEAEPSDSPITVIAGGETLGKAPLSKGFPPGRLEVVLVRGDEKSYRYVFVEPGMTRVLSAE